MEIILGRENLELNPSIGYKNGVFRAYLSQIISHSLYLPELTCNCCLLSLLLTGSKAFLLLLFFCPETMPLSAGGLETVDLLPSTAEVGD